MGETVLASQRIRAGRWEAEILAAAGGVPDIEIVHLERPLADLEIGQGEDAGTWRASAPIPADLLSDGVQTFLIRDRGTGVCLGHFTIVTGVPLEDDIRAELDLLRAELDMLKKAFRRHCLETL